MASDPILKLALPVPLRRLFDYKPPQGPLPAPGSRCLVRFGNRRLVGVVVDSGHPSGDYDPARLQPISKVIDPQPLLPPALLTLCLKAASYYQQPVGEMLATALPVLLRQGRASDAASDSFWRLTNRGRHVSSEQFGNAHRQQMIWEELLAHPRGLSGMALRLIQAPKASLKALVDKGWVEQIKQQEGSDNTTLLAEAELTPNHEQQQAIDAINSANGYAGFLLDGVTGSGKTEVYLQAAAQTLQAGRQVLVLVPEIGLTPQTLERFQARFNRRVACLHSALTDHQRLAAWEAARLGETDIIMGTRSALFTPLARPGLIIVDEAHDGSYKQQDGSRYHARDLALWRGHLEKIPVVLGSATPSLEALELCHQHKLTRLPLRQRAASKPPKLRLEDTRDQTAGKLLSDRSHAAIDACLSRGQQALVFLNRRGYAPLITCLNCGWRMECTQCNRFMTWHKQSARLICHHCDRQRPPPQRCPDCGSGQLSDVGAGTEKLAEQLEQLFPAYPVVRIDRDATRRKGSLAAKLQQVRKGGPMILTGTQMLAKGHHFPHLTQTVLLDADSGFLSADFRGAEQAGQLILQVAGRTGRGDYPGDVIVQTRHPDLPSLQCLMQGDWSRFAEQLLDERRLAELPPHGYIALLTAEAIDANAAIGFLSHACDQLEQVTDLLALGPAPAPMEKRAGRLRFQLLLMASQRAPLQRQLSLLLPTLERHPLARRCRWSIDIDPHDML